MDVVDIHGADTTNPKWDEDFQRLWDKAQKMTDAQREDLVEVMELTASRPDGGSILDGLLARGIGGPDTLRVAIEALRQPMSLEVRHD